MGQIVHDRRQANINAIVEGSTALGIEFGSTRIKAVLIGADQAPIAAGGYEWNNRLENNIWTYRLEDVWMGLQACFQDLAENVHKEFGVRLSTVGTIGISAMMHGYLAFDNNDALLTPFRTWRNTMTEEAAKLLTAEFGMNIPQRWSIAHLYQAILNKEPHVPEIAFLTTLAGYVHYKLTGERVLGVGDASGMFPIDSGANNYNAEMMAVFQKKIASCGYPWTIERILPRVLAAGETAGSLTAEGASLLDLSGTLQPGIPFCPPEGDAGTGMVATNSVKERTGNVSAGTSVFAMLVLENGLSKVYEEIDLVTTPAGKPVAMVHCNNCTTDLDAWMGLFGETMEALGVKPDKSTLYNTLYQKALQGDADCGGLISYNYYSGEHITGFEKGRPLFARMPDSRLTLANFMRSHLYSAISTLKLGMDILTEKEHVCLDELLGHGGLFKVPGVAQQLMSTALNVPVSVMRTASEGGAWGIALLGMYMLAKEQNETLEAYLQNKVFASADKVRVEPKQEEQAGFKEYIHRYANGLAIERAATEYLN